MAKDRLVRRNTAARSPAEKPTMTFAINDLIKISVNPTSWYHHQSVIKEIILGKKIMIKKVRPKNVKEKNLKIFTSAHYNISSYKPSLGSKIFLISEFSKNSIESDLGTTPGNCCCGNLN